MQHATFLGMKWQAEIEFDFTHVDAAGGLQDPPIIAATLISTTLLIIALAKASKVWQ
jgi:hypothetical protein